MKTLRDAIILIVLLSFCVSCEKEADSLELALQFAGNNRPELEKVLKHYSSPADSLKYRAAEYLIRNIPYYYSYKSPTLEIFQKELYPMAIKHDCTGQEAFQMLEKKLGRWNPREFEVVYDAHVITADYLIRNIEQAFKVWHEKPWGRRVSFDDFCEQILPYKVKNEPVEDWRELYYEHFQPVLDSLLTDPNNPMEAINVLWDTLHASRWVYWDTKPAGYPYPGATSLLKDGLIGDCYELASRAVYVMRALGIPGGVTGYLQFPYGKGHHLWNFVPDPSGNIWEFSLNGNRPRLVKPGKHIIAKAFQRCFGVQPESLPMITNRRQDLPPLLNNPFIRDVSGQYIDNLSLVIRANRWTRKDNILYLCTFGFEDWAPVAWTIWRDGKFVFDHVEKDMVYLPAYYKDGTLIPAAPPCYVNRYGIHTAFEIDKEQKQDVSIYRKYPLRDVWSEYKIRIINGKFQADNDSTFSNPVTLHTIRQESDMCWGVIELPDSVTYRYVRYLSGDNGYCNMAEVQLISENGQRLTGKVTGTEGSFRDKLNNRREAVFDGDPLTFFDANKANGAWAGLDLGEPKTIRQINYVFRNDDNNIRLGDTYELFYWDNRWCSLGYQTAEKG
ncbi:MAG: discoidin domain-containing protein, partial [Dysgonamonadaceae bacterium]|nr:discoidin domain-containing protein [Dysgonamonadaceae bacterium]